MDLRKLLFGFVVLLLVSCADDASSDEILFSTTGINENGRLADERAHDETIELRTDLVQIGRSGVAFGHQESTAYGFNWTHSGFPSNSDVLRVAGDYPAVIGFDLGKIERGNSENISGLRFNLMKELIKEAHEAGSIITISWHADNPISGRSSWHIAGEVNRILEGGDSHERLDFYLRRVAEFMHDLVDSDGQPIPVIFRPWHEMNGTWFWWGSALLTPEEYQQLFRSTVEILTETYDVHNALFSYSPNCALSIDDYLLYYPGDEYVDLLGVDVYDFVEEESYIDIARTSLSTISILGNERNKPYAFTETGLENVVEDDWWTNKLYPVIKESGAAYTLVWRNDRSVHWFAPFEGHASADNFREFVALPDVLLQGDIK